MSKEEESTMGAARLLEEDDEDDEDEDYHDDEEEDIEEDYSDEDELDSDEEENQEKNESFALLRGSLQMNDEGRVVYYGKWFMNSELEKRDLGASAKKKRFRLKSKQSFTKEQLNLARPVDSNNPSRTIKFDGFIVDARGMKIRERNVTLVFSISTTFHQSNASPANNTTFVVRGSGLNEFGPFFLDGQYSPLASKKDDKEQKNDSEEIFVFLLEMKKTYDDSQASNKPSSSNKRKRNHNQLQNNAKSYNGKDYYDDEVDEENVEYELAGLYEEACMTVDELERRYQIRKKTGDNAKDYLDGDDTKKRYKKTGLDDDDDDDDDECGF